MLLCNNIAFINRIEMGIVTLVFVVVICSYSKVISSNISSEFAIVCGYGDGSISTASMEALAFKSILSDLSFPISAVYDYVEEKIYFAQYDGYLILRCNLNGSDVEVVLSNPTKDQLLFSIEGFALDVISRVMYFTIVPGGLILKRDIDGGSNITLAASDVISPRALFYYQKRIFWTDSSIGVIRSCDENGEFLTTHVWALKEPRGLCIDPCEEKFYWTDIDLMTIERSDFRGAQREILTTGVNSYSAAVYFEYVYFVDWQTHGLYRILKNGSGVIEEVGSGTERWYHPSNIFIYSEFPCGPVVPTAPSSKPTEHMKTPSTLLLTTDDATTLADLTTDFLWTEQTTDYPYVEDSLVLPITLGVFLSVGGLAGLLLILALSRRRYRFKRTMSHTLHKDEKEQIQKEKEKVQVSVQFRLWAKDALKITFNTSLVNGIKPPAESIDPMEFPRTRLTIIDELGSGAFGAVYKAEAIGLMGSDSKLVAVKTVKEPISDVARSDFLKELNLYKTFESHPNIISMLGYCTEEEPLFLIMEFAPHGNLKGHLDTIRIGGSSSCQEQMAKSLNPTDILTFAYQIANGMDYLASKNCVHRDLAARNILLGEDMVCKLSDFGLARHLDGELQYEMKSEGRVPIRWMAPESVFYNVYTSQSDVWSFGILLWELVTLGSHPYPGMSARRLVNKIQEGYRLSKPPHCSNEMYAIMFDCWHGDPQQRPSFHILHRNITKMLEDAQDYLEMSEFDATDFDYLTPAAATGQTGATSREDCRSSDSSESNASLRRYVGEPGNLLKP